MTIRRKFGRLAGLRIAIVGDVLHSRVARSNAWGMKTMGLDVTLFFTFYGLPLLLKDLDLKMTPLGNPAMKMPMMGGHMGMPNVMSMIPGVDAGATVMMKDMMKKKGVATIPELRSLAIESGVRMIACQMTMDLFEYKLEDMIEGIELGGAATYIEVATQSEINLFI